MNKSIRFIKNLKEYIAPENAEMQVIAFNILALCGVIVSIIIGCINIISEHNYIGAAADFAGAITSMALIVYCRKSGNYKMAMILTVFIVFIGIFTFLYIIQGGYHSGIPSFFIFGVVFTAFLLDGATAVVLIILELIWYVSLGLYSYYHPLTLNHDEEYYVTRVIRDMVLVALSLAITMYFQIRVYRRKQQELNVAILAADEANRAKSDFLAKMSHDIRTPLNTIMAMNELIVSNTSSAKIREWVNDSNVSGRILISLIDDMLDLTKIEAGRMKLLEQPWNTKMLFDEIAKSWKLQTDKKRLQFEYVLEDTLPELLIGDEEAIRKITNNLLSNAIKYTKQGKVRLEVRWNQELEIIVSDTGNGIAPEYLDIIFKPFERGVQEIYRETSGSGLGLAIVKELTDALGGSIDCESVLNKGTSFKVVIPQAEMSYSGDTKGSGEETASMTVIDRFIAPDVRIMVVDDNAFNRKVIAELLDSSLIKIDDVESGYEALEMIDIQQYDLILMDFRMPEMDGAQTLERIKAEYPDFNTPVVALTADIMNGVEKQMYDRGFTGFLSKPVNSLMLYETIARYIPDKIIPIKTEQENGVAVARLEGFQNMLLHYGIDLKLAMEYNAGNADEFLNRVELFEKYADDNIGFFQTTDFGDDYYFQAHTTKSIASGVGAYVLAQLAETAELRKDDEYLRRITPVIIDEYDRVRQGLVKLTNEANIPDEKR